MDLRARGPSQASPPSKGPRDWGKPEKPFPGHSGTALAASGPSPYRSPLVAVPELQAAQTAPGLSLRRRARGDEASSDLGQRLNCRGARCQR